MLRNITRFLLLALVFVGGAAFADPAVDLNDNGVALSGYDPVAYFADSKPTKGSDAFTSKHDGATYWFASAAHRDTFVADPAKYTAQYGGYCAYAASLGKKAPGDPAQWTVLNNKLYINYDARIQKQWSADREAFIEKADKKWDGIKND
jgi:YHS domain-containing protein